MTTLNARANQAWQQHPQRWDLHSESFEEGWETGYKTRQAELPTREQIEQRIRRVHVVVAQEAATEVAGALLKLMGGAS